MAAPKLNPFRPDRDRPCNQWKEEFSSLTRLPNGYIRVRSGKFRDKYLHQAVWMKVAGVEELPDGMEIHHQNRDKECCCPEEMILLPKAFNRHGAERHPFTGKFINKKEAERVWSSLGGRPAKGIEITYEED